MNDVYKFIKSMNILNKTVVAAISGGPDSMFLLNMLIELRNELNIKIVVAHVHHNLRKESNEEALKVEEYCKNNNVIFEMMKIDSYPNNKFSEESARRIRYDFFDKIIKKYNSDILFTAHHGDDLMETILMRITRGSSFKGYAGFSEISKDRGYIIARPLVFLTKCQIEEELNKKNIRYAVDKSNNDLKYTRNRYRHNILPELKKENKDVHKKFIEFNEKVLMINEYLEKQVDKIYRDIINNNEIDVHKFNELEKIIKISLLEKYLKDVYKNNITNINNKHIEIIINLLEDSNNSTLCLPLNKIGIIEYNKFKIIDNIKSNNYEYIFDNEVVLNNGKRIFIDNNTDLTSNFVIHLSSKDIKLPFKVRNRQNGDTMTVKNMLGKKKINDIFTDSKIPKELRDIYPVVTDSTGEIIWIPGVKKSHFDRKKEQKYDIILRYN